MSDQDSSKSSLSVGGVDLTFRRILGLVIGVVALIFVFSNTGEVELRFLGLSVTAPGWVMLLALLLAGFAVGFMLGRKRYKQA
jgi:uncharacterized integral membrane protein